MSKFFRDYYSTQIALRKSKTDYTRDSPTPQDRERIALLDEYVANDDGAKGTELCTEIHEKGRVCRKIAGHE